MSTVWCPACEEIVLAGEPCACVATARGWVDRRGVLHTARRVPVQGGALPTLCTILSPGEMRDLVAEAASLAYLDPALAQALSPVVDQATAAGRRMATIFWTEDQFMLAIQVTDWRPECGPHVR